MIGAPPSLEGTAQFIENELALVLVIVGFVGAVGTDAGTWLAITVEESMVVLITESITTVDAVYDVILTL